MVNLENSLSDVSMIACGMSQGSILGCLLFLICFNDISMAVKCNLFLYADEACLVFQNKNVKDIEKQLNEDFAYICDWYMLTMFTPVKAKLSSSFSLLNVRLLSFRS